MFGRRNAEIPPFCVSSAIYCIYGVYEKLSVKHFPIYGIKCCYVDGVKH